LPCCNKTRTIMPIADSTSNMTNNVFKISTTYPMYAFNRQDQKHQLISLGNSPKQSDYTHLPHCGQSRNYGFMLCSDLFR
jgi:hypothetical protein